MEWWALGWEQMERMLRSRWMYEKSGIKWMQRRRWMKMEVALVWVLLSFPFPHHQCSSILFFIFLLHTPLSSVACFYLIRLARVILLFYACTWSKAVTEMNEISPSCLFIFILSAAHADLVSFKIALDHRSLFPILLCIARHKSFGLPICAKSSFSPLDSQI